MPPKGTDSSTIGSYYKELFGKVSFDDVGSPIDINIFPPCFPEEGKGIDEILVLNPETKENLLNLAAKVIRGRNFTTPDGSEISQESEQDSCIKNFGLKVMQGPEHRVVEVLGIPQGRKEDGTLVLKNNGITILLRSLQELDISTGALRKEIVLEKMKALESKNIPYSLLELDLDGLKKINDAYGHDFGTQTIIKLVEIIKTNIRSDATIVDNEKRGEPVANKGTSHTTKRFHSNVEPGEKDNLVGRFGGDEFVIVLPDCPKEDIPIVKNRILSSIEEYNKTPERVELPPISISMGGVSSTEISGNGKKGRELLRIADERMYTEKIQHKIINIVEVASMFGEKFGENIGSLTKILNGIDHSSYTEEMSSIIILTTIQDVIINQITKLITENAKKEEQVSQALTLISNVSEICGFGGSDARQREPFQKTIFELSNVFMNVFPAGIDANSEVESDVVKFLLKNFDKKTRDIRLNQGDEELFESILTQFNTQLSSEISKQYTPQNPPSEV